MLKKREPYKIKNPKITNNTGIDPIKNVSKDHSHPLNELPLLIKKMIGRPITKKVEKM